MGKRALVALLSLSRGTRGLSAVCDFGISWSHSPTIFAAYVQIPYLNLHAQLSRLNEVYLQLLPFSVYANSKGTSESMPPLVYQRNAIKVVFRSQTDGDSKLYAGWETSTQALHFYLKTYAAISHAHLFHFWKQVKLSGSCLSTFHGFGST